MTIEPYRPLLTRQWDEKLPFWCVIGLNPSTAEADLTGADDPTSRKIRYFVDRDGGGGFWLVNLHPRRATKPADLFAMPLLERLGPFPNQIVQQSASQAFHWGGKVVAAWGANPKASLRAAEIRQLLQTMRVPLWCWGTNGDGSPKHPLYLRNDTPLVPYE